MKTDTTLRVVFFGTPELSVYALEELKMGGLIPSCIVTAPDKPAGRKLALAPSPVKIWAEEHKVPVIQPKTLKAKDNLQVLTNEAWDLFIVAAYGLFLPAWLLDVPEYGVLNIHPSLLPKNRGPSPIRSALRNDEKEVVGVSIIVLDEEMDHGPIVAQSSVVLSEWPLPGSVLDEILFREGGRLLLDVMPAWLHGEITPSEQEHPEATYTRKFSKSEGEIKLTDEGYLNYLKFCAHDGWPGTFFFEDVRGKKVRVKVTEATFLHGVFTIIKVIPEGKGEMRFDQFKAML